ncbi:acetate--CoA ligase family protein [Ottowia sp.]|uniref:acetate--CoA ligase family protein n=1 Tax=Ottowia sp. TaxID=1898956 RepID=UPI0025F30CC4|nr:acetate--CoA ligase family protein [Ottowia sp.]MBK6747982.1 acetate--CoA ligase family protein [Ottowia sp.]
MTPRNTHDGIRAILSPRSVAFIGASEDRAKWGGLLQFLLARFKYAGAVYPVNPKASTIQGLTAYANIRDVPGPVDLAVISITVDGVEQALRDCAAAGVRAAMIVTAQFAETGAEGAAKQARVVAVAEETGIAMIGPNCMGVLNANENLALLNSTALLEYFDTIPRGRIGVASQSGAIVGAMIARAGHIGAGFSSCATLGNQAALQICDFFDYLVDDPATDVICLYMEGAESIDRLFSIARRARAAGKPVLITKAGRTPQGERAVASHTASLAGSYDAFVARCREAGILVQTDALQMLLTAQALQSYPLPRVDGVALFSGSGGAGALGTDALADHGLTMPELGADTRQALAAFVTEANQQLPYDMGAVMAGPGKGRADVIEASLEPVVRDPAVGMCLYIMTPQGHMSGIAQLFTELGRRHGKPCLVVNSASGITEAMRLRLIELGVPFFPSVQEALVTVKDLLRAAHYQAPQDAVLPPLPAGVEAVAASLPQGMLSEEDAKRLLAAAGIPVAQGELAADAEQAARIAQAMGYPVVMKVVADGITHKSDMGGVKLDLADAAAVREAFARIEAAAARVPGARFEGCLVQPMIQGDVELMVGTVHDEQFGPFVLVGTGGTLVELLKDTQLLPAPASPRAIEQALRGLRFFPLLDGYRGREKADIPAIARIVHQVSVLAATLGPRLAELDINPLRVQGSRAVAADARARWVA